MNFPYNAAHEDSLLWIGTFAFFIGVGCAGVAAIKHRDASATLVRAEESFERIKSSNEKRLQDDQEYVYDGRTWWLTNKEKKNGATLNSQFNYLKLTEEQKTLDTERQSCESALLATFKLALTGSA